MPSQMKSDELCLASGMADWGLIAPGDAMELGVKQCLLEVLSGLLSHYVAVSAL